MAATSEKVNGKEKNSELLTNLCEKISIEDEDESGLGIERGENEAKAE